MIRKLQMTLPAIGLTLLASASIAGSPTDYNVSLCQQAVKSQVKLEHEKANLNFGEKEINVTSRGATEVEVVGKGNFERQDGTKKHFKYNCVVDTAAGRVVSASFDKTD
jgi:hypothetical protein